MKHLLLKLVWSFAARNFKVHTITFPDTQENGGHYIDLPCGARISRMPSGSYILV